MKTWLRTFRHIAPRMVAFWFLLAALMALLGWSAQIVWANRLAAEFRDTAVEGEARVITRIRTRRIGEDNRVYRVTVEYEAKGELRRQTVLTQLTNLRRVGLDPDHVRIRWLPRDPAIVELGNERRFRHWESLPFLAILLVLAGLSARAVFRTVSREARGARRQS